MKHVWTEPLLVAHSPEPARRASYPAKSWVRRGLARPPTVGRSHGRTPVVASDRSQTKTEPGSAGADRHTTLCKGRRSFGRRLWLRRAARRRGRTAFGFLPSLSCATPPNGDRDSFPLSYGSFEMARRMLRAFQRHAQSALRHTGTASPPLPNARWETEFLHGGRWPHSTARQPCPVRVVDLLKWSSEHDERQALPRRPAAVNTGQPQSLSAKCRLLRVGHRSRASAVNFFVVRASMFPPRLLQ